MQKRYMKKEAGMKRRQNPQKVAEMFLPTLASECRRAFGEGDIVIAIASLIKSKGLTQAQASKLIGLAQPDVSKLLRGHFAGIRLSACLVFAGTRQRRRNQGYCYKKEGIFI